MGGFQPTERPIRPSESFESLSIFAENTSNSSESNTRVEPARVPWEISLAILLCAPSVTSNLDHNFQDFVSTAGFLKLPSETSENDKFSGKSAPKDTVFLKFL